MEFLVGILLIIIGLAVIYFSKKLLLPVNEITAAKANIGGAIIIISGILCFIDYIIN
jgi:hypothetical protein